MKVFVLGLPSSGRTTVANRISKETGRYHYINCSSIIKSLFRPQSVGEKDEIYEQELFEFYNNVLKVNPNICLDNINSTIKAFEKFGENTGKLGLGALECNFIIDGIINPYDFVHLLDYNKDVVIFLNRTDSTSSYRDHEGVAVNVMRDYCLYLSTVSLMPRNRWLEYNLKIPGEESNFIKQLGKHNTVTITKSLNSAVEHIKGELCKLQT